MIILSKSDYEIILAYDSTASYMILSLMDKAAPVFKSYKIDGNVSEQEQIEYV